MNKALVFVTTLVAGAAVAAAAEPQPAAPQEEPAAKERRICRNVGEVGSRLSRRRICATKAEWEAVDLQNRQAVDRIQNVRPTSGN